MERWLDVVVGLIVGLLRPTREGPRYDAWEDFWGCS
jgi:hypothetical protein